jgi:DNA-binding NarL/FixJ family response regulator
MMPVLDGWATLRELSEDPDTRAIPVIMLTALSSERDVIRGHLEGAVRYVTKPFDLNLLLQTVEEALQPVDAAERARRLETRTALLRRLAELEAGRSEQQAIRLSHLDGVPRDGVRELSDTDRERVARLTGRQRAVAGMLAAGSSARDVAEAFGVSRSNVYATRKRIARKLGVDPDTVPDEARRLGIEPPDS